MTLWKTVEELGLQDSIEKDQAVLDQIVELLRSTYQGKSHNFKKKFFTDYFNNVKRTEGALENLYELIKYRIENDINYIADLKYLALKFNCTLEEARQYQEEQRIKSAPSLEKFQNSFGEIEGLLRYNLTVEFIKNIPLKSRDPYEVTLGIIKAIPEEGLKYSKSDLITLAESSQDLFEEMSELFSEKLCRDSRRYTFYFKVYEYIKEKYPDTWESVIQDRLEAYRKTIGAINPEWCDEWETYRDQVRGLTSTSLKLYGDRVEGYSQDLSKDFHVDHVFSVKAGFLSGVKPEIVAHWSNLQVLSAETNLSKGSSCSKDINELFEDYYESLKD